MSKKGFTLIEVIIVVAIIAVLATIAIVAGDSARAVARDNQRKTDIRYLQLKLEAYRDQCRIYPESLAGSSKSLVNPTCTGQPTLSESLLPKDPQAKINYIYVPLAFPGGTCGASYYLYANLEKNNNNQHVVPTGLTACAGTLPTMSSHIYDVTSPSSFKQ